MLNNLIIEINPSFVRYLYICINIMINSKIHKIYIYIYIYDVKSFYKKIIRAEYITF